MELKAEHAGGYDAGAYDGWGHGWHDGYNAGAEIEGTPLAKNVPMVEPESDRDTVQYVAGYEAGYERGFYYGYDVGRRHR